MFKILTTIMPFVFIVGTSEAQSLKSSSKALVIPTNVINKVNEKLLETPKELLSTPSSNGKVTASSTEADQELESLEGLIDDAKKKLQEERSFQPISTTKYEKIETQNNTANVERGSSLRDIPLTEEERGQLLIGKNTNVQMDNQADIEQDSIYVLIDTEPSFTGGQSALSKFLSTKLTYPKNSSGMNGKVFVRFLVSKSGKVEKVHIARGLASEYNNEAIKAVKQMPNWMPATAGGKAVSAYHILPIVFSAN